LRCANQSCRMVETGTWQNYQRHSLGLRMSSQTEDNRGLWTFFILTFALMLLGFGAMAVFHLTGVSATPHAARPSAGVLLLFLLGGVSPSLAGIISTWHYEGKAGLHNLWKRCTQFNLGWKWYWVIFLIPLAMTCLRISVHLLRGGILRESPLLMQPLSLIAFTVEIFLFGPVSEELGWRGFALERLLAKWSAVAASLVLGIFWAFWHLPLFFIPGTAQQLYGNPSTEFIVFALGVIGGSVVYTWLYVKTMHSLWSVILYHAASNYAASFLVTLMDGGTFDRLLATIIQLVLAAIIIGMPDSCLGFGSTRTRRE
jgi:uncharacterized protein